MYLLVTANLVLSIVVAVHSVGGGLQMHQAARMAVFRLFLP